MTDDTDVTNNPKMFRALNILERQSPPLLFGHEPYWAPPVVVPPTKVHIPAWTWSADYRELPEGDTPVTLDCNGAFLAAIGAVDVAHSELKHHGEMDAWALDPRRVLPGYYLIDVIGWAWDASIVSPLGNLRKYPEHARIWVAAPTLVLLLELLAQGHIGDVIISDSYAAERRTNFRGTSTRPGWAQRLRTARNGLLDNRHKAHPEGVPEGCTCLSCARYQAFKEGYGAALSMMLTGEKCKTRRPDWAHAVYAHYAAAAWRKAWRFSIGAPLLGMANCDELTVLEADLNKAVLSATPPLKLDPSGRLLGHYKRKTTPVKDPAAHTDVAGDDYVVSDTFEDVL
jgi:hypothetical protein